MPFQPGKSGNPAGRSKEATRIKNLALTKTEAAINKLAKIMETSEDEKNVISAANSLLDRGLGKPSQAITGGDEEDQPVVVRIERVIRRANTQS